MHIHCPHCGFDGEMPQDRTKKATIATAVAIASLIAFFAIMLTDNISEHFAFFASLPFVFGIAIGIAANLSHCPKCGHKNIVTDKNKDAATNSENSNKKIKDFKELECQLNKAISDGDNHKMATIYHRMAWVLVDEGSDGSDFMRESNRAQLRHIAESGATRADIIATGCCAACKAIHHKTVSIRKEIKDPQLPQKNCTKKLCICDYAVNIDSVK